jgi:hypothetical protein
MSATTYVSSESRTQYKAEAYAAANPSSPSCQILTRLWDSKTKLHERVPMIGITFYWVTAISLTYNVEPRAYAQEEQLIDYGPIQFSTKIDLGVIIAASALALTILYNNIQLRKAEENMIEQLAAQRRQLRLTKNRYGMTKR